VLVARAQGRGIPRVGAGLEVELVVLRLREVRALAVGLGAVVAEDALGVAGEAVS